jgi:hypothetical protein
MTAEHALAALYRAVFQRLTGPGERWGNRVFPDMASAKAAYPYVVFFWQGGGERNAVKEQDADLVLVVKCISDGLAEAFDCAARISELLNDSGEQDDSADYLNGGTDWNILTSTQEETFHLPEMFEGVAPIYHEGARYRFIMERT